MAIGDKYILTLKSQNSALDPAGTNAFFNVFAYEGTGGTPTAGDCIAAFDADVMTPLLAALANNTEFTLFECINLDNPVDFAIQPTTQIGVQTGEYLPDFTGWEFQYVRAVRGVHHGRKTFSLVSEAAQVNGVATGGQLSTLVTLESALGLPITGPAGTYTPRIWRRAGNYAPYSGTPPVGTPYPDTFYPISGVQYIRLSTQNSRKR